jgi:hypothetical protein
VGFVANEYEHHPPYLLDDDDAFQMDYLHRVGVNRQMDILFLEELLPQEANCH